MQRRPRKDSDEGVFGIKLLTAKLKTNGCDVLHVLNVSLIGVEVC